MVILHNGRVLDAGSPKAFSGRMAGRTYLVQAPALRKRDVQTAVAGREGVVDTVIQGEAVRVVTAVPGGGGDALAEGVPGAAVTAVPPRFEDSYVALLKAAEPRGTAVRTEISGAHGGAADGEPVIRAERLERRFGDFFAVREVSFEVHPGEVFGLLGANGAGKTTTFRMLCGLLPATGGEMRVAGVDLRRAAPRARARIGYMAQKFSLYRNLSVLQNLRFFSSAYNLRNRERSLRIQWALERFDLSEMADATSGELPLGYKQRLALACALMHDPDILFLDEPTSGVDPMARREFWSHITARARSGVPLLVTTHYMQEAEYCDRLAVMVAGRILAIGTPAEVKARAAARAGAPVATLEEAFILLIETGEEEAA